MPVPQQKTPHLWSGVEWLAQPNSGILKKNEHGPKVAVIAAILTTETSYAACTLCQESWWLKEPCHCGQTLRLPENKQRQGLEATVETGRHDLPPRPGTKIGHQTSLHLCPGPICLSFREQAVNLAFAKAWAWYHFLHQHLLSATSTSG